VTTINWPLLTQILQENHRFILTSHIRPDCDALGSELGMAGILEALGKQVTILNGQPTPPNLAFIDPAQRIRVLGQDIQLQDTADADALLVLDTSAWAQLGPMGEVLRSTRARKIVLDHHVSGDDLGAELFKDPTAEATARLVAQAATHLGVPLTPGIATPLFAALATDTGWFRFPSTGAETYRLAAELVQAGAAPAQLYRALYERETLGRLRLRGTVLARATIETGGRLSHTHILQEDFARTGALPSDTEDLVNLLLTVEGVEVALIFVEQRDGAFKISFRSRGPLDCSQVAASFGGGGHKAAAGATLAGTFAEVQNQVLATVRPLMG